MKWFTEREFRCKCCGELPTLTDSGQEPLANVRALVSAVLDPVREKLGRPIVVNSGYRCRHHNMEVGGVKNSQHMAGEAADIAPAGLKGSRVQEFNRELERLKQVIVENCKFDQLIVYPTFLHVSYKRSGDNRHQMLKKGGARYELD